MGDITFLPDSEPFEDEPWWTHSLCGSLSDPDLFFDPSRAKEAKALCGRCPVQRECADANATAEASTGKAYWYGIVAGESANRRRIHAKQRS
jgi:Transcription factor WhiB